MQRKDIDYVLRSLGCTTIEPTNEWVMHSCLLAPWTHKSGSDAKPSNGVKISDGVSAVNCFGCDFKGGFLDYVRKVGNHKIAEGILTQEKLDELTDYILISEEDIDEVTIKGKELSKVFVEKPKPADDLIDCLGTYHPYFAERGITKDTAQEYRLGYSKIKNRALFPLITRHGDIPVMTGRLIKGDGNDKTPKYVNYPPQGEKSKHLYGEHLVTKEHRRVIVVEGAVDSIIVNQYLWKHPDEFGDCITLALFGKDPSPEQMDYLAKFEEVIPLGDNDKPGMMFTRKLVDGFEHSFEVNGKTQKVMVSGLRYRTKVTTLKYPTEMFEGQYKDPAKLKDKVIDMLRERQSYLQGRLARLLKR